MSMNTPTGYVVQPTEGMPAMAEKVYTVRGMTCGHCMSSVSGEVGQVAGVESVDVDLASGRVAVRGDGYTDAQIRAAVDEAGYELVEA
jgi:copper chaperone